MDDDHVLAVVIHYCNRGLYNGTQNADIQIVKIVLSIIDTTHRDGQMIALVAQLKVRSTIFL